uniref:Uncharacterized protein n=1 Tax=Opuntia streptacantha TaxID=393608 RepID=A0A7C9CA61_OPUST
MEAMQMTREGIRVRLSRQLSPRNPTRVMVASATTLASVPASVESSPPLYVPRESLDDITRERSDRFTPSRTSAETNMTNPEITYCGTVYLTITLKLNRMPTQTITSDANNICLSSNMLLT